MAELGWHRTMSSGSRSTTTAPMTPLSQIMESELEPCASTASLFLYSQGSVILSLHHDTLAVDRRFTRHQEKISFIRVDNVSERGAGRLVVSYDFSQTAIVWDLFTGTEISRFASFEPLRVAAWMRNGNVAFGNGKGEVILFEPSTSEHISTRTIFDPITALAPGADCRTYAIGYQNGSILIANLQPTFAILHTLTTSRGPSPIVSLAWHASSSKQKSDMLATQTAEGDLRVWSIAKPPGNDSPRVIRVLKRSDSSYSTGPKWMAWSKNGKIVEYSDRETWIWDVKTKHVTCERIPTIEDVLGIANYGPTATLFTLGPNYTVQQYDVDSPAMVTNVQHLPSDPLLPPLEDSRFRPMSPGHLSRGNAGAEAAGQQRAESPVSGRSRTNSMSSRASSGRARPYSPPVKSAYSGTSFSMTSLFGRGGASHTTSTSIAYGSSASVSSARSRGGSRLRNEVILSPADKPLEDLFPFTRARVNDVPYTHQQKRQLLDESNLTADDLRRQMLSIVFGWDGDIEGLIRDELNQHPPGSQNAIFLSRWLGESNPDQMSALIGSGTVSASAWMFLALSQMGGQEQANKIGQTFVQRLLEIGDIHASATILLALGDRNDAIEVYVSRNYFMEAILMTCLLMPTDWQRQSYLVRRWGEHVVSNSQQHLAIRCFMCTGVEPSEPWVSPTAPRFPDPRVKSPEPRPPSRQNEQPKPENPNRMTVKNSALKLITSFGPQANQSFKFPGLMSDDRTPTNVPGVTPIAESAVGESALSPGGLGSYKLNNARSLNHAMSSRTGTPGGFTRNRLPSIGETPVDVQPPAFPKSLPTPVDSSSDKEKNASDNAEKESTEKDGNGGEQPSLILLPSARYDPTKDSQGPSPQTAVQAEPNKFESVKGLPSPPAAVFDSLKEQAHTRNGSRDRKPEGLHIQWPPPEASESDMGAYPAYTPSHEQTDTTVDTRSPALTFHSLKSGKSGRSIDQYISSLEEAKYYAKQYRRQHLRTRDRRHTDADSSSQKHSSQTGSVDSRGRSKNRYIQPAKRSPSSPVPMSPEEFAKYNASTESLGGASTDTRKHRSRSAGKGGSRARTSSSTRKRRHRSSSRGIDRKLKSSSRNASSCRSRGRSRDRGISAVRSPTSPIPMSPSGDEIRRFEESLRLVAIDRERLRSQQRSSSRRPPDRGTSARRDPSPDRRRPATRSESRQARDANNTQPEPSPATDSVDESHNKPAASSSSAGLSAAERTKREQAAAELEARRLSLARRPSAPNIPLPGETQAAAAENSIDSPPSSGGSFSQRVRSRSNASRPSPDYPNGSDSSSSRGRSTVQVGLPATPRVMRHPKHSDGYIDEDTPEIPDLPTLPSTTYQADAAKIGRSMSVPIVDYQPAVPSDLPHHPRYNPGIPRSRSTSRTRGPMGHRRDGSRDLHGINANRYGSPPPVSVSIEMDGQQDTTKAAAPPILPELQHLTTPPPPPPAPAPESRESLKDTETINIVIDENAQVGNDLPRPFTTEPTSTTTAAAAAAAAAGTPPVRETRRMSVDHRRGRSINESIATKIRNFTGRMRSTSRGPGARSPPAESPDKVSPYESIQMVTADNRI